MPSNLGALYSSRSRKTFFIVLKHTSEHPGLQGEWWYTMGIEQLSCTFPPGLLASLCHFCCLYTFYPTGDRFCVAGPWDFTCRWLNMLSSGNLEAVTSSCVTTSFLLPKWTLHHVWIFFHRPGNDCTQSWSPVQRQAHWGKRYLYLRPFAAIAGTLMLSTGGMWLSLTFPDSCESTQNASKSQQSWPNELSSVMETHPNLSNWVFSGNPSPRLRNSSFHLFCLTPHQWNGCGNRSCCCAWPRGSDKN